MFSKNSQKNYLKKLKKLDAKISNIDESVVEQYDMKSFRIINGSVIALKPSMFNGAYSSDSERLYLKRIFPCNSRGFISYLEELSYDVEAIQLGFDNYNSSNNLEVEIYLDSSNKLLNNYLDLEEKPSSIRLSSIFYKKIIKELLERSDMTQSR